MNNRSKPQPRFTKGDRLTFEGVVRVRKINIYKKTDKKSGVEVEYYSLDVSAGVRLFSFSKRLIGGLVVDDEDYLVSGVVEPGSYNPYLSLVSCMGKRDEKEAEEIEQEEDLPY